MIVLNLPLSPTVNSAYGVNRRTGARYLTKVQHEYREQVCRIVKENKWDFQADLPIKVYVVINFKTAGVNDLDNRLKALFDACTHANVWKDDSWIHDLHVVRGIDGGNSIQMQIQLIEDVVYDF